MGYVAGIGAVNVDVNGRSRAQFVMRDSNPGYINISVGGVTHNAIENLARLGTPTKFAGVTGDDAFGDFVIGHCKNVGIDVAGIERVAGSSASAYMSVLDDTGDMLAAVSDMHILKQLTPDFIKARLPMLCAADVCICDTGLSEQTIDYLVSNCTSPVFCDPVSTTYTKVIKDIYHKFFLIKPNMLEMQFLCDHKIDSLGALDKACDKLLSRGLKNIVVSMGAEGLFYKSQSGVTLHAKPRPFTNIVNATGAGDSAMAGIVYGYINGFGAAQMLEFALGCGMLTLQSKDTVSKDMGVANVQALIKKYIL